jgi:hypothetical protein
LRARLWNVGSGGDVSRVRTRDEQMRAISTEVCSMHAVKRSGERAQACRRGETEGGKDAHVSKACPAHTADHIINKESNKHRNTYGEEYNSRNHDLLLEILVVRIPFLVNVGHIPSAVCSLQAPMTVSSSMSCLTHLVVLML